MLPYLGFRVPSACSASHPSRPIHLFIQICSNTQKYCFYFSKIYLFRSWSDGSAVKNASFSFPGPGLISSISMVAHNHLSETSVSVNPILSCSFCGHHACMWYIDIMQAKHPSLQHFKNLWKFMYLFLKMLCFQVGLHSCRCAHVEVMWRSCVAAFMPSCTCGGQRTTCASQVFSSTAWIPGTIRLGGNFSAIFLPSWFYYS